MRSKRKTLWLRRWRANWRDTLLLLRQFKTPLALFCLAIVGGGLLYDYFSDIAGEPVSSLAEGMYLVLGLTFLQPLGGFPHTWFLQVFYFLMPIIGIGILAQGVADFGVSFFNRRTRSREWEMAVASTFSNHIILIGLGHLGYRVVLNLHQLDQDLVVIELNPSADLIESVRQLGIPVLQDDGSRQVILEAAGIRKARSIILCAQNDSQNLQIAVKAKSLNPQIQVIVRIFDEDFAEALQQQFGFTAMSATSMAAPAFAAAAAGVDITRPITIEGRSLSLARMCVEISSCLNGMAVGELERRFDVSIVLLRHENDSDLHPVSERRLSPGDILAILGGPEELNALIQENCAHL